MLLNFAAIEQRAEATTPVTLIREDLPSVSVAIAQVSSPEISLLSQQLHNYPVGESGKKDLAPRTHGAKYWIAPVRREILVNLDLVVGVQAEQWLCDRIVVGLNGELEEPRYGLPFAGDNNFLFDKIEVADKPPLARWYCPLQNKRRPGGGICQLAVWIDRSNNANTQMQLFAPTDFVLEPPNSAWISLPS